ncbi:ABC transporter ATP-binding protein [Halobacillus sp. A1]|uniref:ABC transporter ATP-binding protein n=1 Tax=Halobacillus sp. A1 TaxID=2880262 RepID=UPI0020A6BD82|nr:ABC transporter ATP-binding protein [Halobacillus sp. A1]MCP3033337.1 ABC transporter ATP-binding protein [Halobacillus sp. A1]
MSNDRTILRLQEISLERRFQPLSFSIEKGSIYALCGGNGAGKTSLFSVLTGMNRPSSGRIYKNDDETNNQHSSYRRHFSYMPDQLAFPNHLTGFETLKFFSMLSQQQNHNVKSILSYVGLTESMHQKVKHYSKGMQQRLNLAQCLMVDVPIYMMDEPTNGLDPYWAHRMKEMLLEQKEQGKSIIFSTHSLSLVEDIADDLLFLQGGEVLINQPVAELRKSLGEHKDLSTYVYHLISDKGGK